MGSKFKIWMFKILKNFVQNLQPMKNHATEKGEREKKKQRLGVFLIQQT